MKRTAIRSHALQLEGRAAIQYAGSPVQLTYQSEGVAYCECGVRSPVLPSTAARQRWHRDVHKPEVRAKATKAAEMCRQEMQRRLEACYPPCENCGGPTLAGSPHTPVEPGWCNVVAGGGKGE